MSNLGLTFPKLLPIAGTWAAPFAAYYVFLSMRVVLERNNTNTFIGMTPKAEKEKIKTEPSSLEIVTRCQQNFAENVPLAFVLLVIAELNGGDRKALGGVMGSLLALRIAHAEFGLRVKGKFGDCGIGRPVGYLGTNFAFLGLGGYAAWLAKGYWGL